MEEKIYSDPAHNLSCRHRFICGAAKCPKVASYPSCYVDRFSRYQPDNDTLWYYRSWEEINRISWREVLSLQESWIYTLLLIIIVVFIFMAAVFIKFLLKIKGY